MDGKKEYIAKMFYLQKHLVSELIFTLVYSWESCRALQVDSLKNLW